MVWCIVSGCTTRHDETWFSHVPYFMGRAFHLERWAYQTHKSTVFFELASSCSWPKLPSKQLWKILHGKGSQVTGLRSDCQWPALQQDPLWLSCSWEWGLDHMAEGRILGAFKQVSCQPLPVVVTFNYCNTVVTGCVFHTNKAFCSEASWYLGTLPRFSGQQAHYCHGLWAKVELHLSLKPPVSMTLRWSWKAFLDELGFVVPLSVRSWRADDEVVEMGEAKWWHALGHAGCLLRWFFEKLKVLLFPYGWQCPWCKSIMEARQAFFGGWSARMPLLHTRDWSTMATAARAGSLSFAPCRHWDEGGSGAASGGWWNRCQIVGKAGMGWENYGMVSVVWSKL